MVLLLGRVRRRVSLRWTASKVQRSKLHQKSLTLHLRHARVHLPPLRRLQVAQRWREYIIWHQSRTEVHFTTTVCQAQLHAQIRRRCQIRQSVLCLLFSVHLLKATEFLKKYRPDLERFLQGNFPLQVPLRTRRAPDNHFFENQSGSRKLQLDKNGGI